MNTFKGFEKINIVGETTVYTGPTDTQSTIIGFSIANTTDAPVFVSAKKNNAFIVKDAPVSNGGTAVVVGGDQKMVIEADDVVVVYSTGTVDVIISVLEIV